ncbi:M23 family peptidase [Paenibacillus sp. CAA11]|uniref:M23 family metallopeptidase n=1 Tax=Paenibacillus sp. CAA11 TaxID=1532905 RepID=UPI000D3B3FAF|nr:M23 family metallopeptidase [Paenibacillus sp. CAA11]AWB45720.1 M23 family peptidase [Paenibacillus sp. CAA11]
MDNEPNRAPFRDDYREEGLDEQKSAYVVPAALPEPDPELLWKQGRGRWREDSFLSSDSSDPPQPGRGYTWGKRFLLQTIISFLIFGACFAIQRYPMAWSLPVHAFISQSLTEEMDFRAAEAWYEEHFGGSPVFIPIFNQQGDKGQKVQAGLAFTAPVEGTVAESFALNLKGVEISPKEGWSQPIEVKSIETGRVLEVTEDAYTGKTVVVQHRGNYLSIYGRLTEVTVKEGDWLEGGDEVGILSPADNYGGSDTLYFAVKKNEHYIDPAEVVSLE